MRLTNVYVVADVQFGMEHQAAASLRECLDFGSTHSSCPSEGDSPLENCGVSGFFVAVEPVRQDADKPEINLIDGNPETLWESQNGAQDVTIVLDLKEVKDVGVVIIKWAGHATARHAKIRAGSSCTSLEDVYPSTPLPSQPSSWDEIHTMKFTARQARVILIELNGLQNGMRNFQIRDIICTESLSEEYQSLQLFVMGKEAVRVGQESMFQMISAPSVIRADPTAGPAGTELEIELDANHCDGDTVEIWIGQEVCGGKTCSANVVTCTVPEQIAGAHAITLRVASIGLANVASHVKYQQTVNLASLMPSEGSLGGGVHLSLEGSGFGTDPERIEVRICNNPCTIVSLAGSSLVCDYNTGFDVASNVGSYERSVSISSPDDEATEDVATGVIMPGRLGFSFPGGDLSSEWSHHEVYLRFVGLDIPRGSVVKEANLRIRAGRKCPKGVNIRIWAEDVDSSTAFEPSQPGSLGSRPRTTSLDWNLVFSWNWMSEEHESVDLRELLGRVVSRDGWTSRSNLTLILSQEKTFPSIACQMVGYDEKPDWAPILQVSLANSSTQQAVVDSSCPAEVNVLPSQGWHGGIACQPSQITLGNPELREVLHGHSRQEAQQSQGLGGNPTRPAAAHQERPLHKDFYVKEAGSVLYFSEAQDLCRSHGARLCTLEELYSERSSGRDMRQPFFGLHESPEGGRHLVPVNVPPPRFEIGDTVLALRKWGKWAGRWYPGVVLGYREDGDGYKYEVQQNQREFYTGDELRPRESKVKDAFEKPDAWSSANNRWAWVSEKQSWSQIQAENPVVLLPTWGEKGQRFARSDDASTNRKYTVGTPCCGKLGHADYMAIDNTSNTYWQSPEGITPAVLRFEMIDGASAVHHVEIEWTDEYATAYSIELSKNGIDFTEVLYVSGGDGFSDEHTLGSNPGMRHIGLSSEERWKWIQIVCLEFRPGKTRFGIRELKILGPKCPAQTSAVVSEVRDQMFEAKDRLTPVISSVVPARGTTAGGSDITITGRFYVSDVSRINVTFGKFPCRITSTSVVELAGDQWEIVCISGASGITEGGHKYVLVTVQGFGSSLPSKDITFWYIDTWSARTTWGGMPPPTGCGTWHDDKECRDSVVIPSGQVVLLDMSLPRFFLILIQGTLIFEDAKDLEMSASYLLLHKGTLQIGTEQVPHKHIAKIVLYGHPKQVELPTFGSKVLACYRCTLDMHGTPQISW